jgi:hypothetical protein
MMYVKICHLTDNRSRYSNGYSPASPKHFGGEQVGESAHMNTALLVAWRNREWRVHSFMWACHKQPQISWAQLCDREEHQISHAGHLTVPFFEARSSSM